MINMKKILAGLSMVLVSGFGMWNFVSSATNVHAATPCIVTLFGQQYDVAPLQTSHTGGNIFVCGTDMTLTYQAQHGTNLTRMIPYIYNPLTPTPTPSLTPTLSPTVTPTPTPIPDTTTITPTPSPMPISEITPTVTPAPTTIDKDEDKDENEHDEENEQDEEKDENEHTEESHEDKRTLNIGKQNDKHEKNDEKFEERSDDD